MVDMAAWITQRQLVHDLQGLGVSAGQVLMVHSSVRAIGSIVGGPNSIIQALLDVLTPAGTLMMYVGWQEAPTDISDWPEAVQRLFYEAHPPYDPRTSRAVRDHGMLVECFRTWPGAIRSAHPDCSMAAIGAQAEWLTADHPFMYGYGLGSPLHKLCTLGGAVLMLGAPLDTLTLLHHAEDRAALPDKRVKQYRCPIISGGQTVWIDLEEYETGDTVIDAHYTFDQIAREYLGTGKGHSGLIGRAQSYLFEAADLAEFGTQWLEIRFGHPSR
jgi:aminoglycoside 3-N-acetyltransferase